MAGSAVKKPGQAGASGAKAGRPAEAPSFEDALARLEEIVEQLEQGELTLEQALAAFEEGARLSGRLDAELQQAERRIEKLNEAGARPAISPLEADQKAVRSGDASDDSGEDA